MTRSRSRVLVVIGVFAMVLGAMAPTAMGKKGPPSGETAGNNLSFPVIWAEGVAKVLPGTPGMVPLTNGAWWYQWGTNGVDPDVTPASCPPDPDNSAYCDDGIAGQFNPLLVPGEPPADNPLPLARAYLQKDVNNVWQAESFSMKNTDGTYLAAVNVDLIDWGDNLESQDWTTRSQVRTEVVLFEDSTALVGDPEPAELAFPMLEYAMRHTSGWGINEVHGLETSLDAVPVIGPGTQATVYSNCARLVIQKLLVARDDPALADLVWVTGEGWTGEGLIAEPLFNKPVWEGGDGPGYYAAEINVKGRIIYGYTWNVRQLNDGPGDYRITFALDPTGLCPTELNTFFAEGITSILVPIEVPEETAIVEVEPTVGGTGVLSTLLNLTYMDIHIVQRGGGGGRP